MSITRTQWFKNKKPIRPGVYQIAHTLLYKYFDGFNWHYGFGNKPETAPKNNGLSGCQYWVWRGLADKP